MARTVLVRCRELLARSSENRLDGSMRPVTRATAAIPHVTDDSSRDPT